MTLVHRTYERRSRRHMFRTLLLVYRAWRKFPHLRLGQLISNATDRNVTHGPHLFYTGDREFEADLINYWGVRPGQSVKGALSDIQKV